MKNEKQIKSTDWLVKGISKEKLADGKVPKYCSERGAMMNGGAER